MISVDASWTGSGSPRARGAARLADAITLDGSATHVLTSVVDGRPRRAAVIAPSLPPRIDAGDTLAAALQANNAMLAEGAKLVRAARPDLIHAHDWSSVWVAAALKEIFGLPVVSTIHRLPDE